MVAIELQREKVKALEERQQVTSRQSLVATAEFEELFFDPYFMRTNYLKLVASLAPAFALPGSSASEFFTLSVIDITYLTLFLLHHVRRLMMCLRIALALSNILVI